jgi:hypothetical protein
MKSHQLYIDLKQINLEHCQGPRGKSKQCIRPLPPPQYAFEKFRLAHPPVTVVSAAGFTATPTTVFQAVPTALALSPPDFTGAAFLDVDLGAVESMRGFEYTPGTAVSRKQPRSVALLTAEAAGGPFAQHSVLATVAVSDGNRSYPPGAMTGNTTALSGLAYGNGTYVASASSVFNSLASLNPFNAFDGTSTGTGSWGSGTFTYADHLR